jgi:hypothetical protein
VKVLCREKRKMLAVLLCAPARAAYPYRKNGLSQWYRYVESLRERTISAHVDTHTSEMLIPELCSHWHVCFSNVRELLIPACFDTQTFETLGSEKHSLNGRSACLTLKRPCVLGR